MCYSGRIDNEEQLGPKTLFFLPALAGKTALDRLNLAAERFFAFAIEQSKYHEILFLTMDHTVEHAVKGALVKDATVSQVVMVDRVRDCMAEGNLKDDDAGEVATLLLATCNGFFAMYVSKKRTDSLPEMKANYDRMYRRLMDGLQTAVAV